MAGVLTPPPTLPPPRPFSFSEAIPLSCSLSMWRECLSSRASRVKPAPSGMIPRQRRPPGTSDSKPVCLWTAVTRRWLQPAPLITALPPPTRRLSFSAAALRAAADQQRHRPNGVFPTVAGQKGGSSSYKGLVNSSVMAR